MPYYVSVFVSFVSVTVPIAAVFGLLAVVQKRGAIVQAMRRAAPEFTTNVWLVCINYILLAPIFAIATGFAASAVPHPSAFDVFWDGVWTPVTVVVAILVIDLTAYWRHRAEHTPLLWPFHATHHSDEAMHWLSVTRKHPIARLFSLLIDNALAVAMGIPVWAIVSANLLRTWWGYFAHCDVPWTLGKADLVMISPAAHRLHHIRDEALMGTNFANTVSIWDRMFGTYMDPTPHVDCETGIAGGTRNALGELARPFEAIAAKIGGSGHETDTEQKPVTPA